MDWNAPIYAFFHPIPAIEYIDGRRAHVFSCNAKTCKGKGEKRRQVRRYLDKGDAKSTSNLRKHAKLCWGNEAVAAADTTKNAAAAREAMSKTDLKRDGSITTSFERIGKGKITYSHRQHTKTESRCVRCGLLGLWLMSESDRAEIVRWVSESMRPFKIVKDRGFQCLMKTGRPEHYIPSPETVSRDVKKVFVRCRQRIAAMLQVKSSIQSKNTDINKLGRTRNTMVP